MAFTIAITGKGGVGKTTVAALLIARLMARGRKPVLAVDADPNTCLDAALGVQAVTTIGRIREETRVLAAKGMTPGVAKQQLLELKIAESLVEAEDFDLLAMGRPEGAGCYCFANNVLKQAITAVADNYPYVVIDNEAGLENLSRRIVTKVDVMIMVADPSKRGLETLRRLWELAGEMKVQYDNLVLAVNRVRTEGSGVRGQGSVNGDSKCRLPAGMEEMRALTGANLVVGLPEDEELGRWDEAGKNLRELPGENPVLRGVDGLLDAVMESPVVSHQSSVISH